MTEDGSESCIFQISTYQKLKFQVTSLLYGIFFLCKKLLMSLLWSEANITVTRYSPTSILVDNTIGSHSYIKLKGVKLHYVEIGNKDLPLALLLHGFPDCWLGWRCQMKTLSNHFRVVAVDLKGFGDSEKPSWRRHYNIRTIMKELNELIYSLGHSQCVLIGHDLGGHIGWYLATEYPDLVHKFVAISSPHPNLYWDNFPSSGIINSRWTQLCQLPILPEAEARRNDISLVDVCLAHLKVKKEDKLIAAYKYVFSRSEDWTGPMNYFRRLPFYRIKAGAVVPVPTLMIVGNKDPFLALETMVRSAEYADKFDMKIIECAGHFPHQEYPEKVNTLLLSFLTVPVTITSEKLEVSKGLIGSLYSNTMKYGNSLVDGVMKKTNGVVRLPSQMLKHSA